MVIGGSGGVGGGTRGSGVVGVDELNGNVVVVGSGGCRTGGGGGGGGSSSCERGDFAPRVESGSKQGTLGTGRVFGPASQISTTPRLVSSLKAFNSTREKSQQNHYQSGRSCAPSSSYRPTQSPVPDNHIPRVKKCVLNENYNPTTPQRCDVPIMPLSNRDTNIVHSQGETSKRSSTHHRTSRPETGSEAPSPALDKPTGNTPTTAYSRSEENSSSSPQHRSDDTDTLLQEPNSLLDYLVQGNNSSPLMSCKKSISNRTEK